MSGERVGTVHEITTDSCAVSPRFNSGHEHRVPQREKESYMAIHPCLVCGETPAPYAGQTCWRHASILAGVSEPLPAVPAGDMFAPADLAALGLSAETPLAMTASSPVLHRGK